MAVAKGTLSAEEHLKLGGWKVRTQNAQAMPRVLVQITQTNVKGRSAEDLKRVISYAVERREDRNHFRRGHAGQSQGLLTVT
jgi:hypothetical protein